MAVSYVTQEEYEPQPGFFRALLCEPLKLLELPKFKSMFDEHELTKSARRWPFVEGLFSLETSQGSLSSASLTERGKGSLDQNEIVSSSACRFLAGNCQTTCPPEIVR